MSMIGIKLEPILIELEAVVRENLGRKPYYSDESFRAITSVFMDAMMDKMYDLQLSEQIDIEDRGLMAIKCGQEISRIIKTFTGKDTIEMFD